MAGSHSGGVYPSNEQDGLSRACYGSISEQLCEIGREIDPVPGNTDSFFESVSKQTSLEVEQLRSKAANAGLACPHNYMTAKHKVESIKWINEVKNLCHRFFWSHELQYQFMTMLHDALNVKIVIIRNNLPPLEIRDDCNGTNERTIVIVESEEKDEYHSTKLLQRGADCNIGGTYNKREPRNRPGDLDRRRGIIFTEVEHARAANLWDPPEIVGRNLSPIGAPFNHTSANSPATYQGSRCETVPPTVFPGDPHYVERRPLRRPEMSPLSEPAFSVQEKPTTTCCDFGIHPCVDRIDETCLHPVDPPDLRPPQRSTSVHKDNYYTGEFIEMYTHDSVRLIPRPIGHCINSGFVTRPVRCPEDIQDEGCSTL